VETVGGGVGVGEGELGDGLEADFVEEDFGDVDVAF
jgi:hypothetical protein